MRLGLAGPVVADESGHLPRGRDEVDVGEGLHGAETLLQPPDLEQRLRRGQAARDGGLERVNRGVARFPLSGMPWVFPTVLGMFIARSFVLGRTRFGRYVYAIGGSAEAARRAGVDLA